MTPGPKTFLFSVAEAEKAVRSDNIAIIVTRTAVTSTEIALFHES